MGLGERAQIRRARVRERAQLGSETEARVGVADDEAVRVQGEEDVAQGAFGDAQGPRELGDALRPPAVRERAQDARGLLDRRHRTKAPRTPRHTRTQDSTRPIGWPLQRCRAGAAGP